MKCLMHFWFKIDIRISLIYFRESVQWINSNSFNNSYAPSLKKSSWKSLSGIFVYKNILVKRLNILLYADLEKNNVENRPR